MRLRKYIINELFDSPLEKFRVTKDRPNEAFETKWEVAIKRTDPAYRGSGIGDITETRYYTYVFYAYKDDYFSYEEGDEIVWVVEFKRDDPMGYQWSSTKDADPAAVNQVFSGVKKSFAMWIRKHKPERFWFEGDDPGHIKVYNQFEKMINKKLGYTSRHENMSGDIRYHFRRNKVKKDKRQMTLPGF